MITRSQYKFVSSGLDDIIIDGGVFNRRADTKVIRGEDLSAVMENISTRTNRGHLNSSATTAFDNRLRRDNINAICDSWNNLISISPTSRDRSLFLGESLSLPNRFYQTYSAVPSFLDAYSDYFATSANTTFAKVDRLNDNNLVYPDNLAAIHGNLNQFRHFLLSESLTSPSTGWTHRFVDDGYGSTNGMARFFTNLPRAYGEITQRTRTIPSVSPSLGNMFYYSRMIFVPDFSGVKINAGSYDLGLSVRSPDDDQWVDFSGGTIKHYDEVQWAYLSDSITDTNLTVSFTSPLWHIKSIRAVYLLGFKSENSYYNSSLGYWEYVPSGISKQQDTFYGYCVGRTEHPVSDGATSIAIKPAAAAEHIRPSDLGISGITRPITTSIAKPRLESRFVNDATMQTHYVCSWIEKVYLIATVADYMH